MNGRKLGTLGRNVLRSGAVFTVMLLGMGCGDTPIIFPSLGGVPVTCQCSCENPLPGQQTWADTCVQQDANDNIFADNATAACNEACPLLPPAGSGCPYAGGSGGTWKVKTEASSCDVGNYHASSGEAAKSTDASVTYIDSTATITYGAGTPVVFHVSGDAAFTGGCESDPGPSLVANTCTIDFNRMHLDPDDFSIPTPVGNFVVTEALLVNNRNLTGTQTGRSFTIPGANVELIVSGYVNGVERSRILTPNPAENVFGVHAPSLGQFGLFGQFTSSDGDLTLTLNLNGTITARPPIANVGASQTVSCNPMTGTGSALLDGSASSDPDGNLQTVAWYDGNTSLGTGITLSTALVVGTHAVTGYAIDTTDKVDSAETTVTVVHDAPPVFDAQSSIIVPACTPGLVILSMPEVIDLCSATSPAVTGEIVEINGIVLVTPIPVDTVTGAVALPSGTAIVAWTASTDGGTATLEQTIEISSNADVTCCGPVQVIYEGTSGADSKLDPNASTGYCMFGYGANDQLKSGSFADFISGGPGNDKLTSQGGDDVIFGDAGNDDITYQGNGTIIISGGDGDDKIHVAFGPTSQIFAGTGDDQVTCDGGNDTIYPGPGRDTIRAGSGNDTVVFYSLCEFDSRKVLNGGAGDDTLIIPVPLSSLPDVQAIGFEHIVVDSSQWHLAECP